MDDSSKASRLDEAVARRISEVHPLVHAARVAQLRAVRRLWDARRRTPFARTSSTTSLPVTVVRHGSLLRRRLLNLDPRLQETKIVNLRLAAAAIDGLLIRPGEVFSFWERVGRPSARRGFVEGLVLSHGEIRTGIGGGLCQLSNLLYWMALHTPLEVVEQHRHGFDPFPDEGRVLPFGSGASVFYNYGDLRLANPAVQPYQLRVWLTPEHLRGAIRTTCPPPIVFHIEERGHRFVREADGRIYRDNEIWRRGVDRRTGLGSSYELITRNHAEVKYALPPETPVVAC